MPILRNKDNPMNEMKVYTDPQTMMADILRAIYDALEAKLYLIGSVIDKDARRGMLEPNEYGGKYIYDKGDMYRNTGFLVNPSSDGWTLTVGSNVKHEPYVLGGKAASWTPLAPLKAWVERKNLAWVDKKTGIALKVEQMAFMIRAKILREGIQPRNVYETVLANREQWIEEQFKNIEIAL